MDGRLGDASPAPPRGPRSPPRPRIAEPRGPQGQVRPVCTAGSVQQDTCFRPPATTAQDRLDQRGPLDIGEVAPIPQVPRDQIRRPPRSALHLDVVVELDPSSRRRPGVGHVRRPYPRVGEISERHRPRPPLGLPSKRNPKVGPPSCESSIGSTRIPIGRQEGPVVVNPEQACPFEEWEVLHPAESGTCPSWQYSAMPLFATRPRVAPSTWSPCVCVSTTARTSLQPEPTEASRARWPSARCRNPRAARAPGLDERSRCSGTAGEDGELQGMKASCRWDDSSVRTVRFIRLVGSGQPERLCLWGRG